ncbi:MAG: hypothetical protein M3Y59_24955 [Myxococcota bacterium]|nr:hypothetical protein [Myxococcota bacterium]
MKTLNQIQRTLLSALGSQAMFSLVNTRLILRTGVDLASIAPAQDVDAALVTKVLGALQAMGYSQQALNVVAQRGK